MTIVRGLAIEEMSVAELVELHAQIEAELPEVIDLLEARHLPKLDELELIAEELERRRYE